MSHAVRPESTCRYRPSPDGIRCDSPKQLFNRSLYCTNLPAVVLAGDMPAWLLTREILCLGRLLPSIYFENRKWSLRHPYRLTTVFKGNRVEYVWTSSRSAKLTIEVFPAVAGVGCWIGISSSAKEAVALRLKWLGIGVAKTKKVSAGLVLWDAAFNRGLLKGAIDNFEPRDYRVEIHNDQSRAILHDPSYGVLNSGTGKGAECHPRAVNDSLTAALKWTCGAAAASKEKGTAAEFKVELSPANPQAWLWWGEEQSAPASWEEAEAARDFQIQRSRAIMCATPSRALDAAVPHAAIAVEGCYNTPFFVHGAMAWDTPYLGWSAFYGGVTLGWTDRLRKEFGLAFAAQETKEATEPYQRTEDLTLPGPDSYFYGRGRVDFHQYRYNMQELFFDQVIEAHAHRLLGEQWPQARKALEEHLAWEKRCFDPADTGLFESCIDTWASDSIWYNGGPGSIATAYNYRANVALGRLQEAERIKRAANASLWLKRKGWYAEYRDAGPDPILHESACLYSVYLPVTSGLADAFQSRQLLQYARHELENVTFKNHPGRLCWLCQWTPYVSSVRELANGETMMLALAAFIAGDADLGWNYLQGVIYDSQYDAIVPGGMQITSRLGCRDTQAATDFAEPVSIYVWTLSRGLAGFRPEVNGPLRWEPSFPKDWSHANLQFPAYGVGFKREGGKDEWSFRQLAGEDLELDIPLPGSLNVKVLVDGQPAKFEIRAQVGAPKIHLSMRSKATHQVVVQAKGEKPWNSASKSKLLAPGARWAYRAPKGCRILELHDPQQVVKEPLLDASTVRGTIDGLPGHRLVFVKLEMGDCPWWQPIEITIKDSTPVCLVPAKATSEAFQTFPLESYFNGQIKNLCDKRCLEPRPRTCGAQIGTDGYSPWTFPMWKKGPPEIDANIWHRGKSKLVVDGIPFLRPQGRKDAVLVSRWSHLPREVMIPLQAELKHLYVLLAVNTNHMQSHVDVLKLTLVGDTQTWVFPLNHPRDVLSGLHEYNLSADRSTLPRRIPKRVDLGNGLQGCVLQLTLPRLEMVRELKWECQAMETIGALLGLSCKPLNVE